MKSTEFVKAYPDDLTPTAIHRGNPSSPLSEAREWSYRFGRLLHAALRGEYQERLMSPQQLSNYAAWIRREHDSHFHLGLQERTNELTFHTMNAAMMPFWQPLTQEIKWQREKRIHLITTSQDAIAFEGLIHYLVREHYVRDVGADALFHERNDDSRARLTGTAQEFDAAIVLLDIMRRAPDLVILPAPMQFERTQKHTNVDFLAIDTALQTAIGIQVKTAVRRADFDASDHERVVLIDGSVDLGNVQAMRTRKNSSNQRVVPWPGMIAAKRIENIKTHGKGRQL